MAGFPDDFGEFLILDAHFRERKMPLMQSVLAFSGGCAAGESGFLILFLLLLALLAALLRFEANSAFLLSALSFRSWFSCFAAEWRVREANRLAPWLRRAELRSRWRVDVRIEGWRARIQMPTVFAGENVEFAGQAVAAIIL